MSPDSLFYLVILVASVAFAALGWASYLVCALRLSRLEAERPAVAEEEADRVPAGPAAPVPAAAIRIAPPLRAEVFEPPPSPDRSPSVPAFAPERQDPVLPAAPAGSAAWMIDGVIDERFEPVGAAPSRDPAQAWV